MDVLHGACGERQCGGKARHWTICIPASPEKTAKNAFNPSADNGSWSAISIPSWVVAIRALGEAG